MTDFNVEVTSNAHDVALVLSDMSETIVTQSKVSAINKSLALMRTAVRKQVASETGIPSKRIGKRIRLKRASKKKAIGRLWFGTYSVKAIELGAKQLGKGRGVSHRGPGGRVKKPHAFIAKMPQSGYTGVFQRVKTSRLPIKEETVSMLHSARVAVNAEARQLPIHFKRLFNTDFNFRLGKAIDKRRVRGV